MSDPHHSPIGRFRRFTGSLSSIRRLLMPYFRSNEKWRALILLGLILVCTLVGVKLLELLNFWNRALFNALQNKDAGTFWHLFEWGQQTTHGFVVGFLPLLTTYLVFDVHRIYFTQWLTIKWRRWLTAYYVDRWLGAGTHYRLSLANEADANLTDNPDQRVAEDVRDFIDHVLFLGRTFIEKIVTFILFAGILWVQSPALTLLGTPIPGFLVWVAIIYTLSCSVLAYFIGRPLFGINFRQQQVEANFRYAAVRVRENAEGIALYGGEANEAEGLAQRFRAISLNYWAFMARTRIYNAFYGLYSQFSAVFAFIVMAPHYFAGAIELGDVMLVLGAMGKVSEAIGWFIDQFTGSTPTEMSIARMQSIIDRLVSFETALAASNQQPGPTMVDQPAGSPVTIQGLTLRLPDGKVLTNDLSLIFKPLQSTFISGPSGIGKSTLFRALAGIWPFGEGAISRPAGDMLFLPQRAYCPLGSLRAAVCYPASPDTYSTEAITHALEQVGLAHLIVLLDVEHNWSQRLSGGELQRLSIARAIVIKPKWLFMDEATASLDAVSEARVYAALEQELPDTTIVSIAHRVTAVAWHQREISLFRTGDGDIAMTEIASDRDIPREPGLITQH